MNSPFICPVCRAPLKKTAGSYICEAGHNFDISKEGYVNLAFTEKGVNPNSGDSKQMCLDRRKFLEAGFYRPLAQSIAKVISALELSGSPLVIDAGCGEGYYLRILRELLPESFEFCGIDLAKEGVKLAAKREKSLGLGRISYAAAGIFKLPFANGAADALISVFAPVAQEEFHRVLKKGGALIVACPGENHLLGLKEKIYDAARTNDEKIQEYDGFTLESVKREQYEITCEREYIPALFGMTPYYWKSSRETQNKVNMLERVTTPCDFLVKVYRSQSL